MGFNFGEQESKSTQKSTSSSQSTSHAESQSTSDPVDLTPEAFKAMQPSLAESLLKWFTGGNPSITPTGGGFGGGGASGTWADYGTQNFTAPETANEQMLRSFLMQDANPAGARQGLINDTMAGKYTDPSTNPFLKDYITAAQRTTMEGLEEVLSRTLPGRFTMAGQFVQPGGSSAFDRAAAIATRGAAQASADIATNIGYNAYKGERDLQQQTIGVSQQETQTTINNLTAQALPRIIQQFGIEQGLEIFKTQLAGILDVLKTAGQLAQPTIGQTSQSTSESDSQSTSKSKSTGTSSSEGWNAGISLSPKAPGVG